jgi:hypothetical protein
LFLVPCFFAASGAGGDGEGFALGEAAALAGAFLELLGPVEFAEHAH